MKFLIFKVMKKSCLNFFGIILVIFLIPALGYPQTDSTNVILTPDYQIHLSQPAKQIKYMMYEKDFTPVQGRISEDKKSVVIKNYLKGSKIRLKVEYEDGTVEEIIKSPCFIDPYIL